jgi:hypothetical protein
MFLAEARRSAPSMRVSVLHEPDRAAVAVLVSGSENMSYMKVGVSDHVVAHHALHALDHAWRMCLDQHHLRDPWMAL